MILSNLPILAVSNGSCATERLTAEHVKLLKTCDDTRRFTECGYTIIMGFKDGKTIVKAHTNSADEMDRMLGIVKPNAWKTGRARRRRNNGYYD